MKNPLSNLSNEKAQKELKQFAVLGLVFGVVPLLVLGWLGIIGLAFSARALVLAGHKGNKENSKLNQYKSMATAGLVLSIVDLVLFYGS